jgi:predicted ATPase
MPSLRIAFSGASGTGKTTLANYVSERFEIPICPVGSRSVAKSMGFDNPYDVDKAGKRAEFQFKLFADKCNWENEHLESGFVTDRTHFDNLAYCMLHCHDSLNEREIDLYRHAQQGYYSHIFLLRVDDHIALGTDVNRVAEKAYHIIFEAALLGLYQQVMSTALQVEPAILGVANLEWRKKMLESLLTGG